MIKVFSQIVLWQLTLCYYDVKDALLLDPDKAEAKSLMQNLEKRANDARQQVTLMHWWFDLDHSWIHCKILPIQLDCDTIKIKCLFGLLANENNVVKVITSLTRMVG